MSKPKFYKTLLVPIEGNVMDAVYPWFKGEHQMTMKERMGSENAECNNCGENEWWLYPEESVCVAQGGKPYIECLNCGYITHL